MNHIIAMAPQGDASGSMFSTIIMFLLIIAVFYFMIIRPQQKKQSERQKMIDAISKGDKVTTVGGMHGTVVGIDETTVLVQIADNVKVKFEKSAIASRKTEQQK
jgi:preprotein translocase subunit YajC